MCEMSETDRSTACDATSHVGHRHPSTAHVEGRNDLQQMLQHLQADVQALLAQAAPATPGTGKEKAP